MRACVGCNLAALQSLAIEEHSMKKLVVLTLLAAAVLLAAQEARREAHYPAKDAAEDKRPNSDQVPDAYAISSQIQRVVIFRLKYNTDLLAGLEKMVKQEKIRNAVILTGVGSVRNYQVHQVASRDFPLKNVYVKDPTMPADIIGMSGYVINGRLHPHITLATPDKAFGGHLEPDTTVYTFAVVTLGVLDDSADLSKVDDWTYR
jgi:predicted DNA-binding protein with PD1-like motif